MQIGDQHGLLACMSQVPTTSVDDHNVTGCGPSAKAAGTETGHPCKRNVLLMLACGYQSSIMIYMKTTTSPRQFGELLSSQDQFSVISWSADDLGMPQTLYVSEQAEGALDEEPADHSEAFCYRVELGSVMRWEHLDDSLAFYSGKVINHEGEIEVTLVDDGEEDNLYIRLWT